jgi:hypothetical protein
MADTSSTAGAAQIHMPRPEMLASVDCNRPLLGDAGADAVGALDLLGPDAAKPGSPVFKLARLRVFAAMLYCDTRGVAEQDRVSGLANHLVQAVELPLRGRDEVAERFTKILQLAKGEDTRRSAVEGIDAIRGTLPGARQLLDFRRRCRRNRIDAFGVLHGRADQAGGAFQPHHHASVAVLKSALSVFPPRP